MDTKDMMAHTEYTILDPEEYNAQYCNLGQDEFLCLTSDQIESGQLKKRKKCDSCQVPFADKEEHFPFCTGCYSWACVHPTVHSCANCKENFISEPSEIDPRRVCFKCSDVDPSGWTTQLTYERRLKEHPRKALVWYEIFPEERVANYTSDRFERWIKSGLPIMKFLRDE
jgi:hypothetical protein